MPDFLFIKNLMNCILRTNTRLLINLSKDVWINFYCLIWIIILEKVSMYYILKPVIFFPGFWRCSNQGWQKPGFLWKNPWVVGFFGFYWVFLGFFGFFQKLKFGCCAWDTEQATSNYILSSLPIIAWISLNPRVLCLWC